ncbi:WD40 domain-containing protein denticleless [Amblyomma americanum]
MGTSQPNVLNVLRGNEYFRRSGTANGRSSALTYSVLKNLHSRAANEYVLRNDEQEVPPLACTHFPEPHRWNLLAVADEDGTIHILRTGQPEGCSALETCGRLYLAGVAWHAHDNAVFDVCPRPGRDQLATASGDLSVGLWDVDQHTAVARFRGHQGSVKCVRFLQGHADVFASGARDGGVMVWDARCSKPQVTIPRAHDRVCSVTPSRKRNRRSHAAHPAAASSVTACIFRDEHHLVTCGSSSGAVKVWDLRKNYQLFKNDPRPLTTLPYPGHSTAVHGYTGLVMDSSGRRLFASCTDSHIYQFDLLDSRLSDEPLGVYRGHSAHSFYVKLALSSDDCFLASGSSDASAYIWQVDQPGWPKLQLPGHQAEVTALSWDTWHPAKLATCGDDNRVLFWDATSALEDLPEEDRTCAKVFVARDCAEPSVAASPKLAMSANPAGTFRTPSRTPSRKASMVDWLTPPTKRRLVVSGTQGRCVQAGSVGAPSSSGNKAVPPSPSCILSPRKNACDSALNVPQRRLLPHLDALEADCGVPTKSPNEAISLTTAVHDLENQPTLQMLETPPRPVEAPKTTAPPSAVHSRKKHKVMARLFNKQASAVNKGKSKAKRALLNTQQQITSFFKR